MSLDIIFAPTAKDTLISTTIFIRNKWGKAASEKFKNRVKKVLLVIAEQPYMYKAMEFDIAVRQGLITKQCSVFYQIHENFIEILFFWDNRQDPLFILI